MSKSIFQEDFERFTIILDTSITDPNEIRTSKQGELRVGEKIYKRLTSNSDENINREIKFAKARVRKFIREKLQHYKYNTCLLIFLFLYL